MSVDPQKIVDTQAWLVKAQRDLMAAEQLLAHAEPLLDAVAYHCQQAGEKALKGFLFWHDIPFGKTHNLEELLVQCASVDATLLSLKESASLLTPLATQFRYPGDVIEPPLDKARFAFDSANSAFTEIVTRLPPEVAPPGRRPTS